MPLFIPLVGFMTSSMVFLLRLKVMLLVRLEPDCSLM